MKKIIILLMLIQFTLISKSSARSLLNELNTHSNSHLVTMMVSNKSKDALSIFSNPGVIASYDKIHINAAQTGIFSQGCNLKAGVVIPIDNSCAIGFAFNRFSNKDKMSFSVSEEQAAVNYHENLYVLSIGRTFRDRVNVGISMKAVQQRIAGQISNLVPGMDVGVTYSFNNFDMLEQTIISATIENFSRPEVEIAAESAGQPRVYRLGVERTLNIPGGNVILMTGSGYSAISGVKFQFATEYEVNGFGTATIGWDENQQFYLAGKINFGGFHFKVAQIYTNSAGYYAFTFGYAVDAGWF